MDIFSIQNLSNNVDNEFDFFDKSTIKEIDIHIQQNGSKNITTVSGIEHVSCDLKKLSSNLSSSLSCSCSIKKYTKGDNSGKKYLKLSGDQRYKIRDYFVKNNYVDEHDIITIHG